MPFINEFLDLLKDTIQYLPFTGTDEYSAPMFGTPVTYPARINKNNARVVDANGQIVTSSAQAMVGGFPSIDGLNTSINPNDRWILSDGSIPSVLSVKTSQDDEGLSHVKLFFK